MSPYCLRSMYTNVRYDVVENVYDTQVPALDKFHSQAEDGYCILSEIEWWKDNEIYPVDGIIIIAQAIRINKLWNIKSSPFASLTRGKAARDALLEARTEAKRITSNFSTIENLYPRKPTA